MPILKDPTPPWMKPGQESVLDSPMQKVMRILASVLGANDPAGQMMSVAAPLTVTMAGKAALPRLQEAVRNTPGAVFENDNLTLDLLRRQLPEQGGMPSVRDGVFWLPSLDDPARATYTGRSGYGGPMRSQARKTFENAMVAEGATGGRVPAQAYDAVVGKGAYEAMRSDVLNAISGYGLKESERLQRVRAVLQKYGGNADNADYILANSGKGNQLAYAVQENIVANTLRSKGYDAAVGYNVKRATGQPRLSEVFDLTTQEYPFR